MGERMETSDGNGASREMSHLRAGNATARACPDERLPVSDPDVSQAPRALLVPATTARTPAKGRIACAAASRAPPRS
jgi:hypothetical protein